MRYETTDAHTYNGTTRPILDEKIGRFVERLKTVIGDESVRSFAGRSGLSEGVVRKYLDGKSLPTLDRLAAIAITGGVSLAWMASGDDAPAPGSAEPQAALQSDFEEEFGLVPGYNIQVSAGHGAFPECEQPTRHLAFRHKWLRYRGLKIKDLVLVFAKGDSMEPTISDNSTVMVDTSQRDLSDGAIFVIRVDNHLVVKRVQTLMNRNVRLISDNKEYPLEELKPEELSDLEVIGRVVWIGKDV